MFYIQQYQKGDCGFACLKTLLANLNNDKNYLYLPQDESKDSYSFFELTEIGNLHQLYLESFTVQSKEAFHKWNNLPIMASMNVPSGGNHMILVTKMSKKKIIYFDPNYGMRKMSYKQFIDNWSGAMMAVKSHIKTPCPYKKPKAISLMANVRLTMLQISVVIFSALGVFFINQKTPIIYAALSLVMALVLEIITKVISLKYMQKMDYLFFSGISIKKGNYHEYFSRIENYKTLYFVNPLSFILNMTISIAFIVLLILNNSWNALLVIPPFAFAVFEIFYFAPFFKGKEKYIADMENSLDSMNSEEELKTKIEEVHRKAYKLASLQFVKKAIYGCLFIVSTIFVMRISESFSLPYIVFYVCAEVALLQSLLNVFSFESKHNQLKIATAKINSAIHQK